MCKYLSGVLLIALLAFGCSDDTQITSADLSDSSLSTMVPEGIVSKGGAQMSDRSQWEFVFSFTFDVNDPPLYYDCVNDGQGEDLFAYPFQTYDYYVKWVETPSGNYREIGKYEMTGGYLGGTSGDVWTVEKFIENVTMRSKGDYTIAHAPLMEWYVNQDGERFKATWLFNVVYDGGGNIVEYEQKVLNCNWLGRQ